MTDTVMVPIPVDSVAAEALKDDYVLQRMGRLVSDTAKADYREGSLAAALRATRRDAEAAGLTDEEIDAELAAHKAERTR